MNRTERHIVNYLQDTGRCSAADILSALNKEETVSGTTLYWYLNKLTKEGRIGRVSRGHYAVSAKRQFIPQVTPKMKEWNGLLRTRLPFSTFCLYQGGELAPYLHNVATNNILYIETERDSCEAAFNLLKENGITAYLRPNRDFIYHYVDLSMDAAFVKPLTSESPVQNIDGITVPTLEKLLVDINADEDFFYLQGSETFYILRNAAERNIINTSRLMRYARRRHVDDIIKNDREELGL